ncbi:GDSL-type esterase/lipase family protein [Sporosarcina luteola]|uniref:GDSL-type esterase/lipase family protein n=1 Tax=Sporosarcina luteola TaxID=582850 RepID=UPI00203B1F41|nr:GDSL-type esterase/lipase family protein [Sporosarcina luteola]MCM3744005.1 GDSL-type esterase/lipase family protein [Sporosarcina luteola]
MEKANVLLAISLVVNVLLIGTGSYVVHKIGGIEFVKTKMQNTPPVKRDSAYYFTKKSVFEQSTASDVDKVFIGDSITDYGEFQEYFPAEVVLNRGIRNDVAKGVLDRIGEVVDRNPREAYLMIGVNDIRYRTDIKDFEKRVNKIVDSFEGKETQLFIQSILPVNNGLFGNEVTNEKVKRFNEILQRIADENGIEYIDLHLSFTDKNGQLDKKFTVDGLHLNGKGYEVWVDRLRSR